MAKEKLKSKNTGKIVLIIVAAIIVLSIFWVIGAYNGLVRSQENVNEKWANVQADYQRRFDLIPNLVATVKAYSNYEGKLLIDVTAARSAWTQASTAQQQMQAAGQLDSTLSRLLVVLENYPNLKANENYLSLQDELAGTENRIKFSRTEFNNAVKTYNIKLRTFPTNTIAGMFGFTQRDMFESQTGAEQAPNVSELIK
ncbi:MAG: LemA family protein [Candidatus Woesearchaeota archaeon]|nr:LemA family protein [Candidatus Woesearchaeota archaeon]